MLISMLAGAMALIATYGIMEGPAYDRETLAVMPFVASAEACLRCHAGPRDRDRLETPARACEGFCRSCHKDVGENHHTVGRLIRERDGLDLPLTARGRMACYTCHDLTKNRFDDKSWVAESLFQKAFSGEKHYKTYYLTARNNRGQLCKKCH